MSADTRLGRGLRVPEPHEQMWVSPDAVKDRIQALFEGVGIEKDGASSPDQTRTVVVKRSTSSTERVVINEPGCHLIPRVRTRLRVALATANGTPLARIVVPEITYLFRQDKIGLYKPYDAGVKAIHELYGEYGQQEDSSPHRQRVSIQVLDFTDGYSRVFFSLPSTIPDRQKISIARTLGVHV